MNRAQWVGERSALPVRKDRGISLLETMIASLIALMVVTGLGFTVFVAMVTNRNQGAETTRLTALADEKIEELVRLKFTDTTTNTTLILDSGWSIGLTASPAGEDQNMLTACPGSGPPTADTGYIDLLDVNGTAPSPSDKCANLMSTPSFNKTGQGWAYQRRWKITDVTSTLKQITVVVYSRIATDLNGQPTKVSLTTFKTQE